MANNSKIKIIPVSENFNFNYTYISHALDGEKEGVFKVDPIEKKAAFKNGNREAVIMGLTS